MASHDFLAGRAERYERIHVQLRDLIAGRSPNLTAAMATICAVLHAKMPHHSWTGFYLVAGDELHVGPYQGPVACQVLRDAGVCIACLRTAQPVVVPDVRLFPGHVPCDPRSRSEIALPVVKEERVVAVFDADSHRPAQFTAADVEPLRKILSLLAPYL
ncbi:MAG: GAF domain-containing protein [Candidatus Bipolaricaulota bacterium]|nr:GAF domain-containing protein [Candidatus Bipolaricaulota bacterium]